MTVTAGPTFPESDGWAIFMSQVPADRATKRYMSTAASAKVALVKGSAGARVVGSGRQPDSALAEFEQIYRDNADAVMGYFARRSGEPQVVADLTSETFVRAAGTFASFDPRKGTPRAWLFGIAARVYARHCDQAANNREAIARLAGHRSLEGDEIEELAAKIDAERAGRELIEQCSRLPEPERAAIELVDLAGLSPKETAAVLGVSRVVLRKRLSRARGRLRKEHQSDG
jgi:RNA polymerase sigma factor (sigma-70 family)